MNLLQVLVDFKLVVCNSQFQVARRDGGVVVVEDASMNSVIGDLRSDGWRESVHLCRKIGVWRRTKASSSGHGCKICEDDVLDGPGRACGQIRQTASLVFR